VASSPNSLRMQRRASRIRWQEKIFRQAGRLSQQTGASPCWQDARVPIVRAYGYFALKTRVLIAIEVVKCGTLVTRSHQYDRNVSAMPPQRNRGDWTPLELFIAGVAGWDTDLRRRLDDGTPSQE
jgi:hypothetical protein